MKIIFPKEIFLAAHRFEIKENPEHNGGSFSLDDNLIEIGTLSMAKDPHYTWMVINHEVFEAAVTALGYRYRDASVDGNYKFFMDHKEFENVVSIASMALCKFIPQDDTPAEVVVGEAN
jgi:hypothetical protein